MIAPNHERFKRCFYKQRQTLLFESCFVCRKELECCRSNSRTMERIDKQRERKRDAEQNLVTFSDPLLLCAYLRDGPVG